MGIKVIAASTRSIIVNCNLNGRSIIFGISTDRNQLALICGVEELFVDNERITKRSIVLARMAFRGGETAILVD